MMPKINAFLFIAAEVDLSLLASLDFTLGFEDDTYIFYKIQIIGKA